MVQEGMDAVRVEALVFVFDKVSSIEEKYPKIIPTARPTVPLERAAELVSQACLAAPLRGKPLSIYAL